jgi:hypothetical protein
VFKGELNSAGIFPKIKEDLRIMGDYSFGFSTKSPEGGYPFYGSDTKYDNKIVLSNNGLQGQGTINFLHSISESNKLTFLPDSTIGIAKFINKEVKDGVKYPDVKSESAYICYVPGKQLLKASSQREVPLTMFNGETVCPEIEQINDVLLDVWGLGEFYVKKNSKSPKVFVHGSRSNMWHLVEKNDRDYSYGISQQDFVLNGVDWAYNKYYKPIQLR